MITLPPKSYSAVLPLYRRSGMCFPLILAVIERSQRGQIFVDDPVEPMSAWVVTEFGFAMLLGGDPHECNNKWLADSLATGDLWRANYLLWYAPPAAWKERLAPLCPQLVRHRHRVRFDFCRERFGHPGRAAKLPSGFELRTLDPELLPGTEYLNLQIGSRFWASGKNFADHGFGVCLLRQGQIASVCYSACIADGLAEIDIATAESLRGKGLATIVGREFVRRCLERGISPTWDCFDYNHASLRLAAGLGLIPAVTYSFYSFTLPLSGLAESAQTQP